MTEMPWGALVGLLFMTMGPIRAIAVFSKVGESDGAPGVRALVGRSALMVAGAFVLIAVNWLLSLQFIRDAVAMLAVGPSS